MAQLALYRSWRPQTFQDVVGQSQVVDALTYAVKSKDFAHAFLFCGSRGTGKTSVAKILAKAINCLEPQEGNPCRNCEICKEAEAGALLDIVEIDAASNNSVDNVRRLTEEIHFMPTKAKYKVYIIDEVHMLSTGAFNALLKTLEEPPQHAVFILATTEVHRIPATITSRCQRFDFRRIPVAVMVERLKRLSKEEGILINDEAVQTIARLADGSLRDAISLLDQVQSGTAELIDKDTVLEAAGEVNSDFMLAFVESFLSLDLEGVILKANEVQRSGKDLQAFTGSLAAFVRDLLLATIDRDGELLDTYSKEEKKVLKQVAKRGSAELFIHMVRALAKLSGELRLSSNKKAVLDLGLITLLAELSEELRQAVHIPLRSEKEVAPTRAEAGMTADTQTSNEIPNKAETELREEVKEEAENQLEEHSLAEAQEPEKVPPRFDLEPPLPEPPGDDEEQARAEVADEGVKPLIKPDPKKMAATTKAEAVPTVSEAKLEDPEKVWQEALRVLQRIPRVDLKMLLAPALVQYRNGVWKISYTKDQAAIFKAVEKLENRQIIQRAVEEAMQENTTLQILMEGSLEDDDNLNPDEPAWVQKLRKIAKEHDLKLTKDR